MSFSINRLRSYLLEARLAVTQEGLSTFVLSFNNIPLPNVRARRKHRADGHGRKRRTSPMRFKSAKTDGFQAFAVSGVNTVSFAITATDEAKEGLLGFAVERGLEGKKFEFRPGFKVFRSLEPNPTKDTRVSTRDHPVQSFVWDDFTAKPESTYVYRFHPIRGTPTDPDRTAAPVEIRIRTEPLFSDEEHDVFFNRGVASSQAYAVRFDNKRPDDPEVPEKKRAEMRQWLSRELDDALLQFIAAAEKGDTLLCCFYEFRYEPVVEALKAAVDRGVDVQVIIDG